MRKYLCAAIAAIFLYGCGDAPQTKISQSIEKTPETLRIEKLEQKLQDATQKLDAFESQRALQDAELAGQLHALREELKNAREETKKIALAGGKNRAAVEQTLKGLGETHTKLLEQIAEYQRLFLRQALNSERTQLIALLKEEGFQKFNVPLGQLTRVEKDHISQWIRYFIARHEQRLIFTPEEQELNKYETRKALAHTAVKERWSEIKKWFPYDGQRFIDGLLP